jgi:hypothetical protein
MNFTHCDHSEGSFIGIQYNPLKGNCFALFNCSVCLSTFSIPMTMEEAKEEFALPELLTQHNQSAELYGVSARSI